MSRDPSLPWGLYLSYSALLPHEALRRELQTHVFGVVLTPVHYRRKSARPVSCYALFKWWLLLSQHPGCLSKLTSLVTEYYLGTLDDGQGCFPLDRAAYPTRTDCRGTQRGIRSLAQ